MRLLGICVFCVTSSLLTVAESTQALAQGCGMMSEGPMHGGMMGCRGNGMNRRGGLASSSTPVGRPLSDGGRLFERTCSQCHALPDPQLHSADQWPAVVARMARHISEAGELPPDKQQIEKIDSFLAHYASDTR